MKEKPLYFELRLQIVFLTTLMAVVGVASITPAFPEIIREFKIDSTQVGLLITVFTLPGVFLTPLFGFAADKYGRKTVLVPSLIIFGITSFFCLYVRSFEQLLWIRLIQGISTASLGALSVTLISDFYEKENRLAAMGYNASVLSIGTAAYPAIGGFVAAINWKYVFLLPVISIPIALLVILKLDDIKVSKQKKKEGNYFANVYKIIKQTRAHVYFFASTATFIILYGSLMTYFPLLMHDKLDAKGSLIGVVLSVMSITTALVSSRLKLLQKYISRNTLLIISYGFYIVAMLTAIFSSSVVMFIATSIIFGLGHGINIPSLQTIIADLAPLEYRGFFMSLNGMVLRLGQTLGPILTGLGFMAAGLNGAFYVGIISALIMSIIIISINNKSKIYNKEKI